jgi:hypothetical protein
MRGKVFIMNVLICSHEIETQGRQALLCSVTDEKVECMNNNIMSFL